MADQYIQVPADSTGKKVATFEKTEGAQTVQVQKVLLAGQTADDDIVPANAAPGAGVYGLPVRKGDGHDVALGATADADTALTVIGRLKKLLTLLPAALVGGRLDVSIGASPATVPVSGTVGVSGTVATDPTDDPARDLGKVDVALLDQYTPQDVDTGGPVVNALPVVLKRSAAGAPDLGTSSDPMRTDPTGTTTQPVSAASLPLPTGAATETTLGTRLSESDYDTKTGSLTETAPATDTASSGLNGRLQRIAQRITSLIALLPAALVGGRLDVNIGASPATVPISAAANVPVSQATASSLNAEVQGDAAHDAAVSGNPVAGGGRASAALPTAVSADGDAVWNWLHRTGAAFVAFARHLGLVGDPYTLTSKTAQYTGTQTGVALWTPAGGKKLVITEVQIQVGGTVAGTVQLWFGASADTTYSRGTDLAIFDGEFAPSATLKPGVIMSGCWIASAVDHILRVTDSAAINPLTLTVWGYEV